MRSVYFTLFYHATRRQKIELLIRIFFFISFDVFVGSILPMDLDMHSEHVSQ